MLRQLSFAAIVLCGMPGFASAAAPAFDSKVITAGTPGSLPASVPLSVDVTGAKQLFLIVRDADDGFTADWADWCEPVLSGPKGELKLTDLKWKSAGSGWGDVRVGYNAAGGPLKVAGQAVPFGIGTHANSAIVYDLPEGYTKFTARCAIDNGGTDQGNSASVRFLVFTETPPAAILASSGPPAAPSHNAADALDGLEVADGLNATLFAAEPDLLSPSTMDIDHLGRVWVGEVVNYRRFNNKEFKDREEGDRILVFEDTNGDGKADKHTVFYQGRDIDSLHGLCVLGNKVIVSASDNVFVFTDENGDLKSDKKELLFTGIGGVNHDHGIHAFVFGPDGKLYFNFGNEGHQVKDKNGKPIIDMAGNEVRDHGQPYRQGMVFRCNLDGSEFETLGWNFRNNWETAVDSFGTLWQSDNDDDGNRGTRINFVMEFGNYGYQDEFTGAGWRAPRTNLELEIPLQHWHLNDPGVVPNLLQTGAGSPTGICINEGNLLPEVFRNQMIHCDAGPNITRAYPVKVAGAGYSAEVVNILEGTWDKWFRPSDVTIAPDGSLFIADWYDPGVGGHRQGDIDRGRVFRLAPPAGSKYVVPKYDYATVPGAISALKSPNLDARYHAWQALAKAGVLAEPALKAVYESDANPYFKARAFWLLSKLPNGAAYIAAGLKNANPDLRIAALRASRQLHNPKLVEESVRTVAADASPAVRREAAVALRLLDSPAKADLWTALATQHDGKDRWYLEALGIGAGKDWDACLAAWRAKVGDGWITSVAGRDIAWRSRAKATPELLVQMIAAVNVPASELPRCFRALDFLDATSKQSAATQLAFGGLVKDASRMGLVMNESLNRLDGIDLTKEPVKLAAINRVLDASVGQPEFVALVNKFNLDARYPQLLALAQAQPNEQVGVEAIRVLLAKQQTAALAAALRQGDLPVAQATAIALGNASDAGANKVLEAAVVDEELSAEVRQQAVKGLTKSKTGAIAIIELAKQEKLDSMLMQAASFGLNSSPFDDVKAQAAQYFPLPPSRNDQPLPPISQLLSAVGNADKGKVVFMGVGTCSKCHVVGVEGREVGPNLTEIGSKLSKEAMFESILYPSSGISHNYETYTAVLNDGTVISGLISTQTPESVSFKGSDALVRAVPRSEIEELKKQSVSLMPADLQKTMTAEELIDVVAYMQVLKKK